MIFSSLHETLNVRNINLRRSQLPGRVQRGSSRSMFLKSMLRTKLMQRAAAKYMQWQRTAPARKSRSKFAEKINQTFFKKGVDKLKIYCYYVQVASRRKRDGAANKTDYEKTSKKH